MKVIAFNGSPRKSGNTHILIQTVFEELKKEGIKTEEINIATKPYRGCMGCQKCFENGDGKCIIKTDDLNDQFAKMIEADGIILGSPVYCGDLSGQMKSFIDRTSFLNFANGGNVLARKIGTGVMAVRRAGALPTLHSLNSFFTICQMIVVGSTYWNMGFGMEEGEVKQDPEGMQTMKNLGMNMAWLLKIKELAKGKIEEPETKVEVLTNFIR
ncbi:MAG: flavodoxin family protein [bacterium]|nr:flavodoxin family protein [bacterium]